ncbi:MAG TPA: hypothetical protein VG308_07045 [Stellaceae bacterium]|jgi:hypothetical protein|nr:hypothetical protein [Stellaceae bacterium]
MASTGWAAEAWLALTGALRLARGDSGGMQCFDASEEGFWHSFRAGGLCFPFYLILLAFPIELGPSPEIDTWRMLAVETIHYVISWVAFPLLMLPLADWLQRGDRYFGFMVAYNWCQVPQIVLFTAVALLGAAGALSAEGMLIADLIVGIAALVYEWFVSRVALAVTRPRAALVILADVGLATLLSHVSAALY